MNNSVLYSDNVNVGFTKPYFYGGQQQFYNRENAIYNDTSETTWTEDILPIPQQCVRDVTPSYFIRDVQFKVRFSLFQSKELEKQYAKMPFITGPKKLQLAAFLNITPRQVTVWFQNRRKKDKKMAKKLVGYIPNGLRNRTSKSNVSCHSPEGTSCELASPSNESIQSRYSRDDLSPSCGAGVYENINMTMDQPQTFDPFVNNHLPSSEDQTFCYSLNGLRNRTSKSSISCHSPEGTSCELPSPSNESIQSRYSRDDLSPSCEAGVYENINTTMHQSQAFDPFVNNQIPSSEDQTFCYSLNGLRNRTAKSNISCHSPEGTSCELPSPSNESNQSHYSRDDLSSYWEVGVYENTNIKMQQPQASNPFVNNQIHSSEDQIFFNTDMSSFHQNRFNRSQSITFNPQKDDRFETHSQKSPQSMGNTTQTNVHPELQRYQAYCQRADGQGTSKVISQFSSDFFQSPENQNYIGGPQNSFVMISPSTEPKFLVDNTAAPVNSVKTEGNRESCQFQPDILVQTPPNSITESGRHFGDDHLKRHQAVDDINLRSLVNGALQFQGVEQQNCGRRIPYVLPNEIARSEWTTNNVSYEKRWVHPQNFQGLGRHQESPKNPDDFIHSSGGPLGPIMNVEVVQRQENHAEHLMESKSFLGDYMPRDSNFGEEFLQEMSQDFFSVKKEVLQEEVHDFHPADSSSLPSSEGNDMIYQENNVGLPGNDLEGTVTSTFSDWMDDVLADLENYVLKEELREFLKI